MLLLFWRCCNNFEGRTVQICSCTDTRSRRKSRLSEARMIRLHFTVSTIFKSGEPHIKLFRMHRTHGRFSPLSSPHTEFAQFRRRLSVLDLDPANISPICTFECCRSRSAILSMIFEDRWKSLQILLDPCLGSIGFANLQPPQRQYNRRKQMTDRLSRMAGDKKLCHPLRACANTMH